MKNQNSDPYVSETLPPQKTDSGAPVMGWLRRLWAQCQRWTNTSTKSTGPQKTASDETRESDIQQILTSLAHATFGSTSGSDIDELLNLALRQLQKIVIFDSAMVLLNQDNALYARSWLGHSGELPAEPVTQLDDKSLTADVFRAQQMHCVSDLGTDFNELSQAQPSPWRSWLGLPLTSRGKKLGMLVVASKRAHQFSENDCRWTRAIGEYIVAALRNAQGTDGADSGITRLSFLLEAARTLSATLNSEEVLQQLLNLTLKHFQPAAVSIALVNPDGSITFQAASGKVADQMIGLHLPRGTGIVGWVAEHGEPVWIPDTYSDPRFHAQTDHQTGFRTQTIYAAPVIQKDRTVAVIEMINSAQDMELEETREIMAALTGLAAPAIQNAVLFEQVYNAEARYQQLFDFNMDPIIIIDEAGQVHDSNREAQSLLEASGAHAQDALEAMGLAGGNFPRAKDALQTQKTFIWEYTLPIPGGQNRTYKAHLTALPQYRPGPSYQWLAHDISDRVALEAMREQLSNMIIHDLRGPLNSIINSMELIRTAWQEKDITMPIEQLLQISLRSAQRMDRLINTILDTARLRQGERPLTITTFDVITLIREAEEISQPMLTHRRQTLRLQLPPAPQMLQGDLDLLRRVLTNLLSNAIKFTPNNGTIALDMILDGDDFRFSVRDNGPGIPLSEQQHIFDMYTRGADTGQIQGSGVGLAFCKLAVEAHGGRIWLKSTPGQGSTFSFAIPRTLPEEIASG